MFIKFLIKKSTPKNIVFGVVFILLVNLVIFPLFSSENVNARNILDLYFGFSIEDVLNSLTEMQSKGREMYLLTTLLIDTPYALIYGFVYALIIVTLLQKRITKINRYLVLTPFFISFFDLLENSGIVYFTVNYPNILPFTAIFVSVFNQLKWIFATITLLIVVFLIFRRLFVKSVSDK